MSDSLSVRLVNDAPARQRVDVVRRALREDRVDPTVVAAERVEWVRLFRNDPQPGLRALILEILDGIEGPEVETLLERATQDRGDGVRLEAFRQLFERRLDAWPALLTETADDPSVEVRLLGAQARYSLDPEAAIAEVLRLCEDEADGARHEHAIRRASEVLAEGFEDPRALPGLRRLAENLDDPEGHLEWAIETLTG